MTNTDKYISKNPQLVHKLKAKDATGRWAYYFIFVPSTKVRIFIKAIEGDGAINLEEYGTVIGSCYGRTPDDQLKKLLKEKYGFVIE